MKLSAHVVVQRGELHLDARIECDANTILMGPNGAGKTTLLRCLVGALQPDAGVVRLDGRTLFDHEAGVSLPPEERRIAYVPHGYGLFPHLTVLRNVLFPMRGDDRWERARELMRQLEISPLAHRMPRTLSAGEQQRVALARAMASEPQLLLLDEPLAALDPSLRPRVRRFLGDWLWGTEVPAVVVTHDPVDARELGSDLVVLEEGRVVQSGAPGDVAVRPSTEFVAALTAGLIAPRRMPSEIPRRLSEDE